MRSCGMTEDAGSGQVRAGKPAGSRKEASDEADCLTASQASADRCSVKMNSVPTPSVLMTSMVSP